MAVRLPGCRAWRWPGGKAGGWAQDQGVVAGLGGSCRARMQLQEGQVPAVCCSVPGQAWGVHMKTDTKNYYNIP